MLVSCLTGVYRFGVWSAERPGRLQRLLTGKIFGALHLATEMATGSTIHREARIGRGLRLEHAQNIRVHPGVRIGDFCVLMHDVTIGENAGREGVAVIGDHVHIGAGAKILGPVTIGDHARIAANSLVLADVPAGATAIGVPARILPTTQPSDRRIDR